MLNDAMAGRSALYGVAWVKAGGGGGGVWSMQIKLFVVAMWKSNHSNNGGGDNNKQLKVEGDC